MADPPPRIERGQMVTKGGAGGTAVVRRVPTQDGFHILFFERTRAPCCVR
ncbi:MAG: hypothetical protein ACLP1X_19910 [Polyangiaceae bacterium]